MHAPTYTHTKGVLRRGVDRVCCGHQGERMSHAVGCAFAACLERKQRREKECGVTASFDASRTSFVREGSFRVTSSSQQGGERDDIMKQLQDKKKGMSHQEMKSSTDTQTETAVTHILTYHWKVTGKSNVAYVIELTGTGFTHC